MPTTCLDISVLITFVAVAAYISLIIGGVIGYCARYGDYSHGYADGYTECFNERSEPPWLNAGSAQAGNEAST